MAVLTGLTITTTVVMGFLIYNRFKLAIKQTAVSNAESMIESTVDKVDTDLAGIRQISNGVNYNIIQEYDISSQEFSRQFSLLYEVNVDKVQSMALYDNSGKLIAAEPVAVQKDKVNVEEQEWYKNASEDIENMHFSTPHIQDLFQDAHNVRFADLLPALAISATGIDILPKQLHRTSPLSYSASIAATR